MSWQDNNSPQGRDPWGGKSGSPPDLDAIFRKLQRQLGDAMGGGSAPPPSTSGKSFFFTIGLVLAAIIYFLSGIYIVQPAERAVITRFGAYERTEEPGPHWLPRLIERSQVINVEAIETSMHQGNMLTMDENIINVGIAVQYRVDEPSDYLFNVVGPDASLRSVSDSALRSVLGRSTLDQALTDGREEIARRIRTEMSEILTNYRTGLVISDLAMQVSRPPDAVQEAFDDAIKAQQDEVRMKNVAEAYARKVVPEAEGRAKRIQEDAKAYKERTILAAKGSAERFNKVLPEYQKAPQVTRDRLYLETMQEVLGKSRKVVIDVEGGNNLLYLPLDKLGESQPLLPNQMNASTLEEVTRKLSQTNNREATRSTSRLSRQADRLDSNTRRSRMEEERLS